VTESYDAIVVGSGPNGLAAAVEIARNGFKVLVLESAPTIGGGTRTKELTLPGFRHDVCSAIHPLGIASPFLKTLDLAIDWIHPPIDSAHPFDDGSAAVLQRSIEATADSLGPDAKRYVRLMRPIVARADEIIEATQSPVLPFPRHPFLLPAFGALTAASAFSDARLFFRDGRARALLAGTAAHTMLPIDTIPAHGLAWLFGLLAHKSGWPFPRGGSVAVADALAAKLRSLGGEIECGRRVASMRDVPASKVVLFDVTPRQLVDIAGEELPARYRRRLGKFKYGPGTFKIDYALDGAIPWRAADGARAGNLHLGGTYEEIAASEDEVTRGRHPERPWVIVAQQSLFDTTRAPAGKHTAWVYCHVPAGSTVDMTGPVEAQIERFAPGFRDLVLARSTKTPRELEEYNENYIGGDIAGGLSNLRQFFTRPLVKIDPYSTPNPRVFLCSSSTPPGAGVHGMCGYHAAKSALKRLARGA
jgi:phytoene dehydrogenase-like protein